MPTSQEFIVPVDATRTSASTDVLAVHSVDHFALSVPRLETARAFYDAFGLRLAGTHDGFALSTADGNSVARLSESSQRMLQYVSLAIDAEHLPAFARRLQAGGIVREDPYGASREGIWFRDPDGVLIEVVPRIRRSPTKKSETLFRIAPEGVRRAEEELNTRAVPKRLGHILRFTPDVSRTVRFYEEFLGLRVADRSGDIIAFMYSPHGSDHHLLAFAHSSRPGFHHASFDVGAIDAIGIGAMRMAELGYREGWGFGRHEAGSNFFHYVRDPWGSFAEYFCDMDYIPAGCDWVARDVPPEHSLQLWGPAVPAYFLENYESVDVKR